MSNFFLFLQIFCKRNNIKIILLIIFCFLVFFLFVFYQTVILLKKEEYMDIFCIYGHILYIIIYVYIYRVSHFNQTKGKHLDKYGRYGKMFQIEVVWFRGGHKMISLV